jgi:hypothetical protein
MAPNETGHPAFDVSDHSVRIGPNPRELAVD